MGSSESHNCIVEWQIHKPPKVANPKSCIIALPGRHNTAHSMLDIVSQMALNKSMVITFRGANYEWYPQPVSSLDQNAAVQGLPKARRSLETAIAAVERAFGFKKKDIALVGYSAGGVMCLDLATHTDLPYAAVACLCGAILEPETTPECQHPDMSIMLVHNEDDTCFDWQERYLPMKNALVEKNYDVYTLESEFGGHIVYPQDMYSVSQFIGRRLGYGKDWGHPRTRN